ncbi:putative RNA-directed DNA polymerase [Tanacetum coccineum]
MNMDVDRNDDGNMEERYRKTDKNDNESGDDKENGEDEMVEENSPDEGSNGGDGLAFRKATHGGREPHGDQKSRVSSEVKEILIQTCEEVSKKRDVMEGPEIVNVNIVKDGPMVDEAHEGVTPPNPNGSGGDRHHKKREKSANGNFKGAKDIRFSHGTGEGSKNNPKELHRRSFNRAKDVARQISSVYNATDGVKFMRCLSDPYKVSHEDVGNIGTGNENRHTRNEVKQLHPKWYFAALLILGVLHEEGVYNACSISENQLKEIGEQIGVTWDEVAGPRKGEAHARESDGNGLDDNCNAKKLISTKWELEAESRDLNDDDVAAWMEARKLWVEKESDKISMLRQKARVRWDVEDRRPRFSCDKIVKISGVDADMLEGKIGENEVWDAICGCGGEKASGPDGFNFKYIKNWEIIKADLMEAVNWLWETKEISRGCNSSFVTIIPKVADSIGLGDFRPISLIDCYYKILAKILAERVKKVVGEVVGDVQTAFIKGRFILDGVLIANETVEFVRKKKEIGLVFKVDFEKAYDSINWKFLGDIMKRTGFGSKWCKWVENCLNSSSMSILVNGSSTEEFTLERGVRQGDPLSLFLFILAAEGLNGLVSEAVANGILKGLVIGSDRVVVSHLQYADDTIFFGEWSRENAKALMCILICFEEVSGLKVNFNKSKLYAIGVCSCDREEMARWMRCSTGEFPFTYLGLLIGEHMSGIKAWRPEIEKFKNRLADWKAKSMSFGGRLTLVKSVLGCNTTKLRYAAEYNIWGATS